MIRSQRFQGGVFILCASAVVVSCLMLPRMGHSAELVVVAVLVLLLGVPHGALDALFARREYGTQSVLGWAVFGLLYVGLAGGVVAIWMVAPSAFLIGFLVISVAHFSGDPGRGTWVFSRLFYGGAIIVLPSLWHQGEVASLFSELAGPAASGLVVPALHGLAVPWLISLTICAAIEVRRDWQTGGELAVLGALAVIAPPLVAFAVFFCAMHSPRHILRTAIYAADIPRRLLVATGLAPMAIVLAAACAAWVWLDGVPMNARIMQILFVGLAALTVPHMMLVERVRMRGWVQAS